jgi:bifunctional NMN adenylyltransferase/nudix hydrolase
MQKKLPTSDVGAIVGRFQVHELHEAHRSLIDTVLAQHDRVIIFLGLSPLRNTINNPLDYNTRKRMIQETYPDVEVYYIEDQHSDAVWSRNLDRELDKWCKPHQTVTLYGSRDSFIVHYTGKHLTVELESEIFISGTEIRRRIANSSTHTKDHRAGIIEASFNRFPTVYTTVDVAILDRDKRRVLMGRKKGEPGLRFIGGFADPNSDSFEADAKREVIEETGLEVGNLQYIGSFKIDDWRYRNEMDKIKTLFFTADYVFGRPEGADDIESVQWVPYDQIFPTQSILVMKEHMVLLNALIKHLS